MQTLKLMLEISNYILSMLFGPRFNTQFVCWCSIIVSAQHFETGTKTPNSQWLVVLVLCLANNRSIRNNSENICKRSSQSEQHISVCWLLYFIGMWFAWTDLSGGMQPPTDPLGEGRLCGCVGVCGICKKVCTCVVCVFLSWAVLLAKHVQTHPSTPIHKQQQRQTTMAPFTLSYFILSSCVDQVAIWSQKRVDTSKRHLRQTGTRWWWSETHFRQMLKRCKSIRLSKEYYVILTPPNYNYVS